MSKENYRRALTVHQLLLLQRNREPSAIAFKMQREYVEAGAALVALDGQRPSFMLHRKIVPHSTRAIANEVERRRKILLLKEVMEEVVERALSRVDPSG